ncbi:MAG: hypothetical protein GWP69_13885 [Gammaproteobacteria bacterium]|jgi:hypothetical protein|nr:hypothetical protein [Gammaproteobacteria bacterium]
MMSSIRIALTLTSLLLLGGCTYHQIASPTTYEMVAIPGFSVGGSVSLINTRTSSEDALYLSSAGRKFYGNLTQWTDTAIAIARRELEKRHATIEPGATKSLGLAITSTRATEGFWGFSVFTTLKVKTGDGYTKAYTGEGSSPIATRAPDAAIMESVAAMFRDQKIVDYLTQ